MIVIDAGHGGWDPGGGSNNYFKEKELTKKISDYQMKRFNELGIKNAIVRPTDETLSPKSRINRISEIGPGPNDIIISNHINTGGSNGGEVIYSLRGNATLPTMIANELKKRGLPIRNVYQRTGKTGKDYYFILRNTIPNQAMIIEYGFADNNDDTKRLMYEWPMLAEGVVKAIAEYLKVPYTTSKTITHIVKPNETLYEIANKYQTTVTKIKEDNGLTTNTIYPLAELIINK